MELQIDHLNQMEIKGAQFSEDRIFRYALWRTFDENPNGTGHVMFIGLNPSTATETEDDPTVRRCIGFAKDWGYSGLYMLNIFAFRSTDPKGITDEDKIGQRNDEYIGAFATKASIIIVSWGIHGKLFNRGQKVLDYLDYLRVSIYCLGQNKDGSPKHPLYLKKTLNPIKLAVRK